MRSSRFIISQTSPPSDYSSDAEPITFDQESEDNASKKTSTSFVCRNMFRDDFDEEEIKENDSRCLSEIKEELKEYYDSPERTQYGA